MVELWESMEEAVLEEMTGHGDDGQDGEFRRGRAGDQGDGGVGSHLCVRQGGGRVSRSSKEFEDLRWKFEQQDIRKDRPHSQKMKSFKDILSEKDGGPPFSQSKMANCAKKENFD